MISLNVQKPEKQSTSDILEIEDIWPTIQGEGPFAGTPAIFIRMSGCNLACHNCDTDYTSKRTSVNTKLAVELVLQQQKKNPNISLIVITGGEPFRQQIDDLVHELTDRQIDVQIETNGTLYLPFAEEDNPYLQIVCSPKTSHISKELEPFLYIYKYILHNGDVDATDGLPLSVLGKDIRPFRPDRDRLAIDGDISIYVQPEDTGDETINQANIKAAVESCMKFGYKLSLQTHKIIGVP